MMVFIIGGVVLIAVIVAVVSSVAGAVAGVVDEDSEEKKKDGCKGLPRQPLRTCLKVFPEHVTQWQEYF